MLGIGGAELAIIGLFALLIFGPERLPELGRTAGKALKQFKDAQEEMTQIIRDEVYDPEKDGVLFQDFQNLVDDFSLDVQTNKAKAKPKAYSSAEADQAACGQKQTSHKQELLEAYASEPSNASQHISENSTEFVGESFAQKKARLAQEKEEKLRLAQELYAQDNQQGDEA